MKKYLAISFLASLLIIFVGQTAFADDKWYVGEGLKEGDYFRYNLCHADYKSCTEFEMDFWVKGKTDKGDWDLEVVVHDGNKIVKDTMEIGRAAPEPLSPSKTLQEYAAAYRSSIAWLSGYVTRIEPQSLSAPAWGKIGNIGGVSVGPLGTKETVTVEGGTFDTYLVGWHKSTDNKIWVVDNFPFPVKALTFTDVTTGTIPTQFKFELLEYGNTANPPEFLDVSATEIPTENQCPRDDSIKRGTANLDTNKMIIGYSYSPEHPKSGCEISWHLDFSKSFDVNQFESDVHYDIFVVDDEGVPIRSLSNDNGRDHLFSPAGKELVTMEVKESKGLAKYVIYVYGTGKDGVEPNPDKAGKLEIDIDVAEGTGTTTPPTQKDTDGDGIQDSSDKCPKEKETINGFNDSDGCPDVVPPPENDKPNPPLEVTIDIPDGASNVDNAVFYDRDMEPVTPDSTITWTNSDSAAHTVTSGTPTEGPDGKFDSGLFGPGKTFTVTLKENGVYEYFCQVHPWMTGQIFVDPHNTPEFPVGVIVMMILVTAIGIAITKFKSNILKLKI